MWLVSAASHLGLAEFNPSVIFESLLSSDPAEATASFRALCAAQPAMEAQFLQYMKVHRPERAGFALRMLTDVSDGRRLMTGLQQYLRSGTPTLRAQAALLIARGSRNLLWVEDMLTDSDPRVRAAVMDGIRTWNTDERILHKALADESHRVVCSAVVNLWHVNQSHSRHMLECLLAHTNWRFRASGTWALGACGCPTLRPLAIRMKTDPHPSVRWNALRALSAIHRAASPPQTGASPPEPAPGG